LTIFSKRTNPRSGGILDRYTRKASFVLPSDNNGQIGSLTVICKQYQEIFLAVSSCHAQITASHHHTQMWSHHGVYHIRWCNNLTLLGARRKLVNTTYIGVTTFSQHMVGQEPSETLSGSLLLAVSNSASSPAWTCPCANVTILTGSHDTLIPEDQSSQPLVSNLFCNHGF